MLLSVACGSEQSVNRRFNLKVDAASAEKVETAIHPLVSNELLPAPGVAVPGKMEIAELLKIAFTASLRKPIRMNNETVAFSQFIPIKTIGEQTCEAIRDSLTFSAEAGKVITLTEPSRICVKVTLGEEEELLYLRSPILYPPQHALTQDNLTILQKLATHPDDDFHLLLAAPIPNAIVGKILDKIAIFIVHAHNKPFTGSIQVNLQGKKDSPLLQGRRLAAVADNAVEFTDLKITLAGEYRFEFTAGDTLLLTSNPFQVGAKTTKNLAFLDEPQQLPSGQLNLIRVALLDAFGQPILADDVNVTISIDDNPSGGILQGSRTVTASSGYALFSGLKIDKALQGYTFQATAEGYTSGSSKLFGTQRNVDLGQLLATHPDHAPVAFAVQNAEPVAEEHDAILTLRYKDSDGDIATTLPGQWVEQPG